ncbi:MAG: carotenoid oxygenase family protein [Pseudanabaena sp. ELA607]
MTTTSAVSSQPSWGKAIAQPAREFPLTDLTIVEGAIPEGLRGSLYRNGPARLERGGMTMGHWFDGDGAILAVHLADGKARATYRYVQTAGYQAETKAERLLYGNYGMTAPGAWWERFGKSSKNVANTSVLALPDQLLALWEGGLPHSLDLTTLETKGLAYQDVLQTPYSAHPKRDSHTGAIFNFGVSYGKDTILHLYRSDAQGQIQQKNQIPLSGSSMIHDFVLAGKYLIFCIPPLRMNPIPLLLNLTSYSDALQWQPQEGTEILIVDRDTLELVSRNTVEPWFQWHFGNGYTDRDGNLVLTLVRYPDFATNQFLKEIASGQAMTPAQGILYQMRLNPTTAAILEATPLINRGAEFPTVSPLQVGQASEHTYLLLHRQDVLLGQDLFNVIARYDHQHQALTEINLGNHLYPMEPLFAPHPDQPESGWLLTVVFDGVKECSEVYIFDVQGLENGPVCRLGLPSVVPMGFHGTWQSKN